MNRRAFIATIPALAVAALSPTKMRPETRCRIEMDPVEDGVANVSYETVWVRDDHRDAGSQWIDVKTSRDVTLL